MQNGLYKVSFQTPSGGGDGVVVLTDGELRGGDAILYYAGTYTQNGDQFSAQVAIDRHSNTPGMESVFGIDLVTISIVGTSQGDTVQLTGVAAESPGISFQASLTRLCD